MRGPILLACVGLLVAACDREVEAASQTNASPESASPESDRVRVCRAATNHFNQQEPVGARTVRQDSADRVELSYAAAAPAGAGLSVECAFQGDQVTWRPVVVQPETLTYGVDGNTVRLTQRKSDGSRSEITWTSQETPGVTTETNLSVQVEPGSTTVTTSTEAE